MSKRVGSTYPKYVVRGSHIPEVPIVNLELEPATCPLPIAVAKAYALEEWRAYWGADEVTPETIDRFAREFKWRWYGDHLNRYQYLYLWAFEFMQIVYRQQEQVEAMRKPLFRSEPVSCDSEVQAPHAKVKRFIVLNPKKRKFAPKKGRWGGETK